MTVKEALTVATGLEEDKLLNDQEKRKIARRFIQSVIYYHDLQDDIKVNAKTSVQITQKDDM